MIHHHGIDPCLRCDGYGVIKTLHSATILERSCEVCAGTGTVDYHDRQPLVEEDWVAAPVRGENDE